MRRLVVLRAALLLAALLLGCSQKTDKPASTLTEAERDTAIARSSLPGAGVVQRALDVSGDATQRATRADSTGY